MVTMRLTTSREDRLPIRITAKRSKQVGMMTHLKHKAVRHILKEV